jgi:hypothetical protein
MDKTIIKINGVQIADGIIDWFQDEEYKINLVILGDDEDAPIYARSNNSATLLEITIKDEFIKKITTKKPDKMLKRVKFTGGIVGGKAKGKAELETALGTINLDDSGTVGISGSIEL